MKTVDQVVHQRLPDLCVDQFAFALRLRQSETQDKPFEAVREALESLLTERGHDYRWLSGRAS